MKKTIITIFIGMMFVMTAHAAESLKERTARELTAAIRAEGGNGISYEATGTTIILHYTVGRTAINSGQMTTLLGAFLKPPVVAKMKKAGFKRGMLFNGIGNVYPFEISTKYYNESAAFFKKMAGER